MWKNGTFGSPAATPSYEFDPATRPDLDPASCKTSPSGPDTSGLDTEVPTLASPCTPKEADSPFRVRQIRFAPTGAGPRAVAVTSGCCYMTPVTGQDDRSADYARLMQWTGGAWNVTGLFGGRNSEPRSQTLGDSLYSVAYAGNGIGFTLSAVASPGGPLPATGIEPASQVLGNIQGSGNAVTPLTSDSPGSSLAVTGLLVEAAHPDLSSLRLVAGDGDLESHPPAEPTSEVRGASPLFGSCSPRVRRLHTPAPPDRPTRSRPRAR
jgi:hypothetical protein